MSKTARDIVHMYIVGYECNMKTQNDIAVYTGVYIGLHVTYILLD